MRRTLLLLAPAAVLTLSAIGVPAYAQSRPAVVRSVPASVSDDALAAANFAWANVQRAAAGVAPLQVQSWAQGVAQGHSQDMAATGNIFHNMSGYMGPGHSAMGATYLGENVAVGTNLDYAQSALITSAPHRANLLDARFNYVGIGAATDASGQVYITEDFAQIGGAPAAAPAAAPVAAPAPAPAPRVVAPAPKPVVVPNPVLPATPKPAPVVPAPVARAVAAPAAPAPAPSVAARLTAPAVTPSSPAGEKVALKLSGVTKPIKPAAALLYGGLGVIGAAFALGLGYKLTRLLPGR
jgi:uncharacterized protein YkwD